MDPRGDEREELDAQGKPRGLGRSFRPSCMSGVRVTVSELPRLPHCSLPLAVLIMALRPRPLVSSISISYARASERLATEFLTWLYQLRS